MNTVLDWVGSMNQARAHADTGARWEWRTFPMVPIIGRLFEFIIDGATEPTAETYVLSALTPHQVKIRHGHLVVKELQRMNDFGLELWQPVLEAAFPIDWPSIEAACAALGIRPTIGRSELESVDDFLGGVVGGSSELLAVSVIKRRTPLRALGCHGEFVELAVRNRHYESVAFDDESPERVQGALSYLGLASKPNVNYPSALKRIAGMRKPSLSTT